MGGHNTNSIDIKCPIRRRRRASIWHGSSSIHLYFTPFSPLSGCVYRVVRIAHLQQQKASTSSLKRGETGRETISLPADRVKVKWCLHARDGGGRGGSLAWCVERLKLFGIKNVLLFWWLSHISSTRHLSTCPSRLWEDVWHQMPRLWLQDWCWGSVSGGLGLQLARYVLRLCCKSFWWISLLVGFSLPRVSQLSQYNGTWKKKFACMSGPQAFLLPSLNLSPAVYHSLHRSHSVKKTESKCSEVKLALATRSCVNSHRQCWSLISTLPSFPNLSLSLCLLSSLKLCQINLEGKTFYSKKDKPLCKGHAFAPVWESEVDPQKKEHFSPLSLPPDTSIDAPHPFLPTAHLVKLSPFFLCCRLCFRSCGLMPLRRLHMSLPLMPNAVFRNWK